MKLLDGLYVYEKPGMGQYGSHTYVLIGTKKTLMIDPGFRHNLQELVIKQMVEDGLNPQNIDMVANTHLHLDHSDADEEIGRLSRGWVIMHRSQFEFLNNGVSAHEIFKIPQKVDSSFEDELDLGKIKLKVIQTPGHTPCDICFYWPEKKVLISGDLIFEENVGRVDLPGSDEQEEKRSLQQIAALDVELLLPAHGKIFKTKEETRHNIEFVLQNWALLE